MQEPAIELCPKCGALDAIYIIRKDDGKVVQVCKKCGWDSEADEIFNDSIGSDNEIPIF